jgi:hypothetical protein
MAVVLLTGCVLGQSSSQVHADIGALTKETEQVDQRDGKMGMFWWIPTEFWEESAAANGRDRKETKSIFAPLNDYTVIVVAVGTLGVGDIEWMPDAAVRKSLKLRDQAGNLYDPLTTISPESQVIADVIKPIFKNILGPMGEGVVVVFFPGKDAKGTEIANPHRSSEFSLQVSEVMGPGNSIYTWRLPVSALLPPKYCPVGKEKVEANWRYCPWHGNKLFTDPELTDKPKARP